MEVTNLNFNEVLPQVIEAISNATFLSIDCEFTGLNIIRDINAYDTQKQYYEKVKNTSNHFLVIQYGLSAFRYDDDEKCFKQQSYNFYIFRRPIDKYLTDQRFLCQTSSIDFLISNGFDFNKLFKNGIPYLNISEETKFKETLEENQKARASNAGSNIAANHITIPKEDVSFINDIVKQIHLFLSKDEEELVLPKCNSFLRRLIWQTVDEKFNGRVTLESRNVEKDRLLVVTKPKSKEELAEKEQKKIEKELNMLDEAVGFSKVLKAVVSSGKLIVGHNMFLDLLHTVDKFLTPLPEDYTDFKDCLHSLFSKILDTKYMCSSSTFKTLIPSNVLDQLLNSVTQKPFQLPKIEIEQGCMGYTLNDGKAHEAGYDAFITGVCFLAMWNHLALESTLTPSNAFKDFDLLKPYLNRLHLMRLQDSPYVHLGDTDPNPSRDHVFYMTFPAEWKTNDIVQLFSPFGSVNISWINGTSAYIGLYKRDQAAVALSTLSQSDRYSIMTYARRQAQLVGTKTVNMSPRPKKSLENNAQGSKRRRTGSFGENYSKRSFETIQEAPEEESAVEEREENEEVLARKTPTRKRKLSKTFNEDSSWD